MYLTGYTQVTSRGCNYITTAHECECVAAKLGLLDTTATIGSYGSSHRMPGCFYFALSSKRLYFNTNSASTKSCMSNPTCVCRATSYTQVTSGRACSWITSRLECESAAAKPGLKDTTAYISAWRSRPRGCFYHPSGSLYFNTDTTSPEPCLADPTCVCRI